MKSSISPASSTTPAGTITTAYDYGYAADGGRRWRKDYANNVWTWYPCGVACNAGELVEQTSDLTGNTWTTSAPVLESRQWMQAQIIRRNAEYHHFGLNNSVSIITDNTSNVLSSSIYDAFASKRYAVGSSQSLWITNSLVAEVDGITLRYGSGDSQLAARKIVLAKRDVGYPFPLPGRGNCKKATSRDACLQCCSANAKDDIAYCKWQHDEGEIDFGKEFQCFIKAGQKKFACNDACEKKFPIPDPQIAFL